MNDQAGTPDSAARMSETARDYALHAAERAREGAAAAHENVGQATAVAESFAAESLADAAKISRETQGAMFDDAKAAIVAFENMVRAKSLAEAAQIHMDFLGERSRVNLERMKSAVDFVRTRIGDRYAKWTWRSDKAA